MQFRTSWINCCVRVKLKYWDDGGGFPIIAHSEIARQHAVSRGHVLLMPIAGQTPDGIRAIQFQQRLNAALPPRERRRSSLLSASQRPIAIKQRKRKAIEGAAPQAREPQAGG